MKNHPEQSILAVAGLFLWCAPRAHTAEGRRNASGERRAAASVLSRAASRATSGSPQRDAPRRQRPESRLLPERRTSLPDGLVCRRHDVLLNWSASAAGRLPPLGDEILEAYDGGEPVKPRHRGQRPGHPERLGAKPAAPRRRYGVRHPRRETLDEPRLRLPGASRDRNTESIPPRTGPRYSSRVHHATKAGNGCGGHVGRHSILPLATVHIVDDLLSSPRGSGSPTLGHHRNPLRPLADQIRSTSTALWLWPPAVTVTTTWPSSPP